MFVERAQNGEFIVDSSEIADRFGLSLNDFRRHMQRGSITSSVEVGTADHEGARRLSLRFGNRLRQIIIDNENRIRREELTFLRSGARSRRP